MSVPVHRPQTRLRIGLTKVVVTVLSVVLAGCVSIPTSGPVEPGVMPSGSSSARVQIEPAPPATDASPGLVVEGFLHAMSNSVGDYAIARSYLSDAAREDWRPNQGVLVYDDSYPVTISEDKVVLDAPLEGELGPDGAFTPFDKNYRIDFGLVKDPKGQWRITNPPKGVLISQYLFDRFYTSYNLYFFDPGYRSLVPDPIFVERSAQPLTPLLAALLSGPSRWLRPAVVSALPLETAATPSTHVDDGIVDVAVQEPAAALDDVQRSRMAAQIVWTLRQVPEVAGVRFLLYGQRYEVREQNAEGVIPVDAYTGWDPVHRASQDLYVATKDGVSIVRADDAQTKTVPVPGSCAELPTPISSFALNPSPVRRLAAVSRGQLVTCGLDSSGELTPMPSMAGDLLRPQYDRFGELWAMANLPNTNDLYKVSPAAAEAVDNVTIADSQVRAFRISPDGTRMAVIKKVNQNWQLGLVRIEGDRRTTVSGWREVTLAAVGDQFPRAALDVGWADATTLMVLATEPGQSKAVPYVVNQDGTNLRQIGPGDWTPRALATFPQSAGAKAVVVSTKGSMWRYQDDYRWPFLVDEVLAASYVG